MTVTLYEGWTYDCGTHVVSTPWMAQAIVLTFLFVLVVGMEVWWHR